MRQQVAELPRLDSPSSTCDHRPVVPFAPVYDALRSIMLAAAGDRPVTVDDAGSLVVRTAARDARGEPGWFGTVTVKKSYVAYHLMPLYTAPELAAGLSPALEKRRQGKTCFNFKTVDETLFTELAALTVRAAAGGQK